MWLSRRVYIRCYFQARMMLHTGFTECVIRNFRNLFVPKENGDSSRDFPLIGYSVRKSETRIMLEELVSSAIWTPRGVMSPKTSMTYACCSKLLKNPKTSQISVEEVWCHIPPNIWSAKMETRTSQTHWCDQWCTSNLSRIHPQWIDASTSRRPIAKQQAAWVSAMRQKESSVRKALGRLEKGDVNWSTDA